MTTRNSISVATSTQRNNDLGQQIVLKNAAIARSTRPSSRVEAVISAAVNNDDYAPFEELLTVLAEPYADQPQFAAYAEPPLAEQRVLQTFYGT